MAVMTAGKGAVSRRRRRAAVFSGLSVLSLLLALVAAYFAADGGQDAFLYVIAALGACGYFAYRAWAAAAGRKVGIEKDDCDPYTYGSWPG
jgi:hypothetical protein